MISTKFQRLSAIPMFSKLSDVTGSGNSKMAATKLPECIYISISLYPRNQRNFNGYTYVFGVKLSNKESGDVVRPNGKKPKVENPRLRSLNFQLACTYNINEIATAMRYTYVFGSNHGIRLTPRVQLSNKWWQCCTTKWEEIGSGKTKMAASKLPKLVSKILTKFNSYSNNAFGVQLRIVAMLYDRTRRNRVEYPR